MTLGIIGGTGLSEIDGFKLIEKFTGISDFGEPSAPISKGTFGEEEVLFLPRHGHPHQIPPHQINYRANIDALAKAGVTHIVAVNAVGGIHSELGPACIAVPDQVLDYTYGRAHTIYDGSRPLDHIDFTYPYSAEVRDSLLAACEDTGIGVLNGGVYAATQGPRLETAAEVVRIRRDGGDMIGMTGMPEAAIARELGIEYACLALSVNWCAGMTDELITMEDIRAALDQGMSKVLKVLSRLLASGRLG